MSTEEGTDMVQNEVKRVVSLVQGAKVKLEKNQVEVTGKHGTVKRTLVHPKMRMVLAGNEITISTINPSRKELALLGTWEAHIKNMMQGVTEGFTYKMKIVYAHFPMKALVKGKEFVIENFLGEKYPRTTDILGDTKVSVKAEFVELTGPNVEDVGQTAANIERACRIRGFDPRVFQDGIYIIEKPK
jgi:large subunit ribosomal protein L6